MKRYVFSEIVASLLSLGLSTGSAVGIDSVSTSKWLISAGSAVGGTLGFVLGMVVIFCVSHWPDYRQGRRVLGRDIRTITHANMHGVLAMYAFRIPFQYLLLHVGVHTAVAAFVAQACSGGIAVAVRYYHSRRANLFAAHH
jgi:hypothetical protein